MYKYKPATGLCQAKGKYGFLVVFPWVISDTEWTTLEITNWLLCVLLRTVFIAHEDLCNSHSQSTSLWMEDTDTQRHILPQLHSSWVANDRETVSTSWHVSGRMMGFSSVTGLNVRHCDVRDECVGGRRGSISPFPISLRIYSPHGNTECACVFLMT